MCHIQIKLTLDNLLVINKIKPILLSNMYRVNENYLFALIDSHIIIQQAKN